MPPPSNDVCVCMFVCVCVHVHACVCVCVCVCARARGRRLVEAEFAVGVCFRDGSGVTADAARAAQWMRRAADRGLVEAQYRRGPPSESGSLAESLSESLSESLPSLAVKIGLLQPIPADSLAATRPTCRQTDLDRLGQTRTDSDRLGQTQTDSDRLGQTRTESDRLG